MSRATGFPEGICLAPCVVATNVAITLSGEKTVNGKPVVAGDRVIVKDQADASENGIYVCDTSTWTRATDMNETADMASNLFVMDVDNGELYQLTYTGTYSPGTTEVTFANPSGGSSALYLKLNTSSDQTIEGSGAVSFASGTSVTFNAVEEGPPEVSEFTMSGSANFKQTMGGNGYFRVSAESGLLFEFPNTTYDPGVYKQGGVGAKLTIIDTEGVKFLCEGADNIQIDGSNETAFSSVADFDSNGDCIGLDLPIHAFSALPSVSQGGFIYVSDAINSAGATGTIAFGSSTRGAWIDITDNAAVHQ